MDIYPTLCELAGLPLPESKPQLDGQSFAAVLRDPSRTTKNAIYHCYPRSPRGQGRLIGRAVRTARHRLVEWKKPGAAAQTAELELYDYQTDPAETRNLAAEQPERVQELLTVLSRQPEAKPQVRRPASAKKDAK